MLLTLENGIGRLPAISLYGKASCMGNATASVPYYVIESSDAHPLRARVCPFEDPMIESGAN